MYVRYLVSMLQQLNVTVNLYGNIVSNACGGLVSGPGLVPDVSCCSDFDISIKVSRYIYLQK